jgi:hypothetical protein
LKVAQLNQKKKKEEKKKKRTFQNNSNTNKKKQRKKIKTKTILKLLKASKRKGNCAATL